MSRPVSAPPRASLITDNADHPRTHYCNTLKSTLHTVHIVHIVHIIHYTYCTLHTTHHKLHTTRNTLYTAPAPASSGLVVIVLVRLVATNCTGTRLVVTNSTSKRSRSPKASVLSPDDNHLPTCHFSAVSRSTFILIQTTRSLSLVTKGNC